MTIAFARARGFSRPERVGSYRWNACCSNCNVYGPYRPTKGEASKDAFHHNKTTHA